MDKTFSKQDEILNEVLNDYEEWIEEAELRVEGGAKDALIRILVTLLMKERNARETEKRVYGGKK